MDKELNFNSDGHDEFVAELHRAVDDLLSATDADLDRLLEEANAPFYNQIKTPVLEMARSVGETTGFAEEVKAVLARATNTSHVMGAHLAQSVAEVASASVATVVFGFRAADNSSTHGVAAHHRDDLALAA